jgi:tRNA 5-methylaminomethyl-2-thiouridine biosynthesis bifunctional protein
MDWRQHWRGKSRFTIFDGAFDEARYRAMLDAWHADAGRPARLHVLALADTGMPGARRMPQKDEGVTLDLINASTDAAFAQLDARLDAINLRGIERGRGALPRALGKLASPGALLHDNGAIEGVFTSRKPPSPWARSAEPVQRAIVLGAGLAGSAACERLCARGWNVTLVERHSTAASEASGNQAGIYMPLLSKDDNIMTRLSRASFLYALAYWEKLGGIVGERCGVLQLARNAGHAAVQQAISDAWHFPPEFAKWLQAGESPLAPDGAWLFQQAGWARPSSICHAMLDACGPLLTRRFGAGQVTLQRQGDEWIARGENGAAIASAPVIIVANGAGALQLSQTAHLPLAKVRGQVTHLAEGGVPELPFVLCREAYLTPAVEGWHSLGASYDSDEDPMLRASSQEENLDKIRSLLGDPSIGRDAPLQGRVGFRCVAPDRLPLAGALPEAAVEKGVERLRQIPRHPGLYGLLGYASRGLTWAPLAAELLASQLHGDPLPLEADLATALDPARFILRARRSGQ